jgi:septal ring factor EnvC (AmiA/AmiB activator)
MVDVKLDVGGTTAYKAVNKKTNSSNVCGILSYLLLISALAFLALDAMEFISLGIVKDVMGLKVLKTEEFLNITTAFETTKKALAEKETSLKTVSGEIDALKGRVNAVTGERDGLNNQVSEKDNQIKALTEERDDFKTKLEGMTAERDGLKKQIEEAAKKAEEEKKDETSDKKKTSP